MRANNVLGIIYSNKYDCALSEITNQRTMGSVPFAGRYRLIDFNLSSMVNCGISKVGVITKSNYRSLMDHLGTGKPWDLSRKREGLFILPPFNTSEFGRYDGRISALCGIMSFLNNSKEEYVVLSDCNVVCNFDYNAFFEFHKETNSDITIAYKNGKVPNLDELMIMDLDDKNEVTKVAVSPMTFGNQNYSLNIIVMRKSLLERLINDAVSMNQDFFERDIIQASIGKLKVTGYKVENYAKTIDSLQSYYDISMSLLKPENCKELFTKERPVYTKVRDDMPAIYGLGAKVKNSLVANGCIIDGEVENSILFRGVRVGAGAVIKNSIIMQGSYIGEKAYIDSVIMDKVVVIKPHKTLCGAPSFPVYVGKGIVI